MSEDVWLSLAESGGVGTWFGSGWPSLLVRRQRHGDWPYWDVPDRARRTDRRLGVVEDRPGYVRDCGL